MNTPNHIYNEITHNISVSVVPKYEISESFPAYSKFVFSYTVVIENLGDSTVKLISRHWYIIDSLMNKREVKGEGVIGQQPELKPGESFRYTSWSPLTVAIGKMYGSYYFLNLDKKSSFTVKIPAFKLIASFVFN